MENMVFKGRIDVVVYAQSREESALLMEQEGARLSVSAKHRPSDPKYCIANMHPCVADIRSWRQGLSSAARTMPCCP